MTRASATTNAVWIAGLSAASVALTLGFACAAPLAAIAAFAALRLERSQAIGLVGSVWFANQLAGFALLSYPLDQACVGWGVALGMSALLALEAARRVRAHGMIASFVAAFAAYEAFLFALTVATGSDLAPYAPAAASRVLLIEAISFAALAAVGRLVDQRAARPARGFSHAA